MTSYEHQSKILQNRLAEKQDFLISWSLKIWNVLFLELLFFLNNAKEIAAGVFYIGILSGTSGECKVR